MKEKDIVMLSLMQYSDENYIDDLKRLRDATDNATTRQHLTDIIEMKRTCVISIMALLKSTANPNVN